MQQPRSRKASAGSGTRRAAIIAASRRGVACGQCTAKSEG
jgi:hypothetical protein